MLKQELERQVAKALCNWEFNSIENVYRYAIVQLDSKNCHFDSEEYSLDSENSDIETLKCVYMGYINFLYQIGKFQEILCILKKYDDMPEWWDGSFDFNLLSASFEDIQNDKDFNISKIETLPKEIQPYYFAYYVSEKIKSYDLTPKQAMEIFERLFHSHYITTKAYLVAMLIEYFSIQTQEIVVEFFMPMKFTDKQYLILTFLHSQCDTLGARIYWDKFNTIVRELLQKDMPRVRKRLAVGFYGVLRGAWQENLQEILDISIKPLEKDLEVDCFLFSWDEYQQWSSLMGGEYWADRVFNAKIMSKCPQDIAYNNHFRDLLPNVYEELQSEYNMDVDLKKLQSLKNKNPIFKKWLLESQMNPDFNFPNAKLPYSCKATFNLIQSYEREQNIEYDYVMLIRSDTKPYIIKSEDIYRLLPNEISDYMVHFGSSYGGVVGFRESIKNYVSMWDNRQMLAKNKYISGNCICNNHEMGFKYPALFNCRIVKPIITHDIRNTTALKSICFPDIKEILDKDLKVALEKNAITKDKAREISDFFNMLMKKYKRPSKDSRIYYRMSGKVRDNKILLYYKLGQMALKNANVLGYFKIPFKHAKIKKHFDIRQSEIIPNITEMLEYKVGEALNKVSSNWYRGSYLWFYDKMRRLKKQYKKKA